MSMHMFVVELFHTEKAHVRNLKVMHKLFYTPMQSLDWIPIETVKLLFPNLDEMITIHSKYPHRNRHR